MTKKDKYFFTFVFLYMICNFIAYLAIGDAGLFISNGVFIGIGLFACIFKDKIC